MEIKEGKPSHNNHREMEKNPSKITRSTPKVQGIVPALVKPEKQLTDLVMLLEEENQNFEGV